MKAFHSPLLVLFALLWTHLVVYLCLSQIASCSFNHSLNILDFGALPDGKTDNTAAIHKALSEAKRSSKSVYIPSSTWPFVHHGMILVDSVLMYGDGYSSWLHGSNENATAIQMIGANVQIANLRLTSVAQERRTTPQPSTVYCNRASNFSVDRIWTQPLPGEGYVYDDTHIHGVGGIFIYGCFNGTITNNSLNYTFADGIHMTAGSRDILIENNMIENSGDDGIACVTYLPKTAPDMDTLRRLTRNCGNLIYRSNRVKSNRWGRGMTVIGGDSIIIEDNTIEKAAGSGVWIASESSYNTSTAQHVMVRRNTIVRPGVYGLHGKCHPNNTLPAMGVDNQNSRYAGSVQNIMFLDNLIMDACLDSFRITGREISNIVFAGNTLLSSARWGMYIAPVNGSFFLIGNTITNSTLNSYVGVNEQEMMVIAYNKFSNALLNGNGRIQIAHLYAAQRFQFTNNSYSQNVSTNAKRMIEAVVIPKQMVYDHSNTSVYSTYFPNIGKLNVTSFELPLVNDLTFTIPFHVNNLTLTEQDLFNSPSFPSSMRGRVQLLAVFSGTGGQADMNLQRNQVTFRMTLSNKATFRYSVILKEIESVATATITIERQVAPPSPPVPLLPSASVKHEFSSGVHSSQPKTSRVNQASERRLSQWTLISKQLFILVVILISIGMVF
ncbi:hypothetical protein C9374_009145 [Naegleria lovaniensis]|uniref:Rhamnogalacturonase A/B/Epimerase-like pectate lyase domain-containing protein n=1 Tax=Naegleria lovaniensis TaxID=51637 RepID=A0AA88GHK7_NAELO|nr:uncharacterized protein C9374_009145 [Naegleria lovaniensis]KAG2377629.1 hypothetical protein C9374_009145 [Naegleria lovaniensis]